ncbi:MAG: hypothetical protein RI883_426 [Bacteroidota bacterium]|jgi:hypothetical protein
MCISWNFYPEKSARIYAKLVHKIGLKKKEIDHQTCFHDTCYAIEMNDRVMLYLEESYLKGTQQFLTRKKDIFKLVEKGELVLIQENEYYILDTMWYSYPYLIAPAKDFLDELGYRFQRKLENTGLECTQFVLTSMLRTTSSVARLRKWNRNSIKNSAHLHGTTFDVSYRSFKNARTLTTAENLYLGDVLSKTLWELRQEKRCWTTYETWQTCFHVVVR